MIYKEKDKGDMEMRKFNLFKAIAVPLAAMLLLTSCTPWAKAEQKKWVKELGEEYPDDDFEYLGNPPTSILIADYSRAAVSSELYDTSNIVICEKDGELYSNYPAFVHEDACRDEFDRFFKDFPCSYFTVGGYTQKFDIYTDYPIKDISDKKFIKKYMKYECFLFLFYDDVSDIPSEKDIEDCVLDLIKSEPHKYDLTIFCSDSKYTQDEAIKNWEKKYVLKMKSEKTISSFYVVNKEGDHREVTMLIEDKKVK